MRIVIVLLLLIVFAIGFLYFAVFAESEPTEQTLADAEASLIAGDLEGAEKLIKKYLKKFPDSFRGNLVAGDVSVKFNEVDKALPYYEAALVEDNPKLMETQFICGRLCVSLGKVADGENYLREVLEKDPTHIEANQGMFQLLRSQARYAEMAPHFMQTIRASYGDPRRFNVQQLLIMAAPFASHLTKEDSDFVENCMKNYPDDPLPLLGRARNMLRNTDVLESIGLLADICEKHPGNLTAHGYLGRAVSRHGNSEQVRNWNVGLPEDADQNPDIWLSRGRLCEASGHAKAAARCYWEGLKVQAVHAECAFLLGRLLAEMPEYAEKGRVFQDHARSLHELTTEAYNAGPRAPGKMRVVVNRMVETGRLWEAAGWCFAARNIPSEQSWAELEIRKLYEQLRAEPPFVRPTANPANDIDLSGWELPDEEAYLTVKVDAPTRPARVRRVLFREEAQTKGIDFRFNNSSSEFARMFEFSGGGASILDFDLDGWPDVYFTQGAKWPVKSTQTAFLDTIYRNVGGTEFEDVSELAIEGDPNFSQGAAIGDFDNDGFADIFVGNIGPNTFYRNNGDGTFSRVELPEDLAGDSWTIGAMIADLDTDGLPDIYALNYLAGDDLFTRRSQIGENQYQQCPSAVFAAAPDQVLMNNGEWGLNPTAEDSPIAQKDGKSFGLTLFRDAAGAANIYIANDQNPNTLTLLGDDPVEDAFGRRAALGAIGRADVGTGIAVGDANNDGLMDLFVTNSAIEHNNMFLQDANGKFSDEASDCGVREISYYDMGWGAQFIDADLDGNLDLIIANGKLQEMGKGSESSQRPHYVHNLGEGRFMRVTSRLGRFFSESTFGRAVVRFDWNRDGLPDAIMTHRGSAQSLLTNYTKEHGDAVRLNLVGTTSPRDAVGAIVRLTTDSRTLMRQITAGDGFQCSNQKQIVFGLNPDETIQSVTVTWPSGQTTEFESAPRNVDSLLIEGTDSPVELVQ